MPDTALLVFGRLEVASAPGGDGSLTVGLVTSSNGTTPDSERGCKSGGGLGPGRPGPGGFSWYLIADISNALGGPVGIGRRAVRPGTVRGGDGCGGGPDKWLLRRRMMLCGGR